MKGYNTSQRHKGRDDKRKELLWEVHSKDDR